MNLPSIPRLRIQFVLPFTGLTGGNKCVLEYANRLKARGHDVWLIHDYPDIPFWKPRGFALTKLRDWGVWPWVDWFDVHVPVVRCPGLEARYVPDADAVLATYYRDVPAMAKLPPGKGRIRVFGSLPDTQGKLHGQKLEVIVNGKLVCGVRLETGAFDLRAPVADDVAASAVRVDLRAAKWFVPSAADQRRLSYRIESVGWE